MQKYSAFSLFLEGLRGHRGWGRQWRAPAPKPSYDIVIVGAGGHGLATAYYLAAVHGITDVAVIEKGWLGGGNTGRNTTIIRSNYLYDESAALYEHALKLWEGLSQELNYNLMFSQRGVMMLAHNLHDVMSFKRHIYANRLNGVDNEWLSAEEAKAFCPPLNMSRSIRYPVLGAALQRRGGTARHDAVAWGYARAADARGVDIIQNCAVTGVRRGANGAVAGVETTRGFIGARRVGVVAAGSTASSWRWRACACRSRAIRCRRSSRSRSSRCFPASSCPMRCTPICRQSDKGELVIGAGTDAVYLLQPAGRPAHRRRIRSTRSAKCSRSSPACACCAPGAASSMSRPTARRSSARRRSPGLYVNCGWGTGGFKATPGSGHVFAHTMATGEPHAINAPFALDRFRAGRLIDEAAGRGRRALRRAMLLIDCPYCGPRAEIEFRCGGQAHIARPDGPAAMDDAAWAEFLFVRDNPKGLHAERWHHTHGCQRLFNARARHDERRLPRDLCDRRAAPIRRPQRRADDAPFRLPAGGRIDRAAPLAIEFRRPALSGFAGDTLASALLANGVHLVGRSFKYHRPRGILGAGAEEPNALVDVDRGAGARYAQPPRDRSRAHDGLVAQSQNRWPSLALRHRRDQRPAFAALPGRLLLQDLHVAAARSGSASTSRRSARTAGLGRAPAAPDPDRYTNRYAHCEC